MTKDQVTVYDFISREAVEGWLPEAMPFKLWQFRSIRDTLVRAGLIMKTTTGRYAPVTDKP